MAPGRGAQRPGITCLAHRRTCGRSQGWGTAASLTHGQEAVLGTLVLGDLGVDAAIPGHGVCAHRLHASSQANVVEARLDGRCHAGNGLEARGALPAHQTRMFRISERGFRLLCRGDIQSSTPASCKESWQRKHASAALHSLHRRLSSQAQTPVPGLYIKLHSPLSFHPKPLQAWTSKHTAGEDCGCLLAADDIHLSSTPAPSKVNTSSESISWMPRTC